MTEGKFDNHVVVITGGSSGIGLAAARLFVQEGAQIVLIARDPDRLATLAREMGTARSSTMLPTGSNVYRRASTGTPPHYSNG